MRVFYLFQVMRRRQVLATKIDSLRSKLLKAIQIRDKKMTSQEKRLDPSESRPRTAPYNQRATQRAPAGLVSVDRI